MMRYLFFLFCLVSFGACQSPSRVGRPPVDSLEVEELSAEDTTLVELYVGRLVLAERDTLDVALRLYESGRYDEACLGADGASTEVRTLGTFQMRSDTLVLTSVNGVVQRGLLGAGVLRLLDANERPMPGHVLRSVDPAATDSDAWWHPSFFCL